MLVGVGKRVSNEMTIEKDSRIINWRGFKMAKV